MSTRRTLDLIEPAFSLQFTKLVVRHRLGSFFRGVVGAEHVMHVHEQEDQAGAGAHQSRLKEAECLLQLVAVDDDKRHSPVPPGTKVVRQRR